MDIESIFNNNKKWITNKLNDNPDYFKTLAEDQSPEILFIGCSDSRVTTGDVMGIEPGDMFVHRNIANMVSNTDLSAMSVINYAVNQLKVKHVIICGHYNCGGVKAAMQAEDMGILNPWLRNVRDVYRLHKEELNSITDEEQKYNRLVELNVQEQCVNLIKTAEVQKALLNRHITIHGWVFDIHTGHIIDMKIDFNKILKDIMEIYRLV